MLWTGSSGGLEYRLLEYTVNVRKIWIGEECDAFSVNIVTDKETISYRFLQEDSVAIMADMFKELGYDAEYEEVY